MSDRHTDSEGVQQKIGPISEKKEVKEKEGSGGMVGGE